MFSVLYFIAAHSGIEQLGRLVRALKSGSPGCQVLIHYNGDRAALAPDIFPEAKLDGVHILPEHVSVYWADFSQVEMVLIGIDWALEHLKFDWFVFLSGQDYPLMPLRDIEHYMETCRYDALMRAYPIDQPDLWPHKPPLPRWRRKEGQLRYYFQFIFLPRFPYYYRVPEALKRGLGNIRKRINQAESIVQIQRSPGREAKARLGIRLPKWLTPFDETFRCYAASAWFSASGPCVEYIHNFVHDHPRFVGYYRHTWMPSESFFLTIVYNNPQLRVLNDDKRYNHWRPRFPGDVTIGTIRNADLEAVLASGDHFGRKFDMAADATILDELDERMNL